jgi:hypothetical protein
MFPEQQSPFIPPCIKEVFEALSRGRHISAYDPELYADLQLHFELYKHLFQALGFALESNARGFYYFEREGSASDAIEQAAVFLWIIVDWMADKGMSISEQITLHDFVTAELPHFQTDRYRSYMDRLKVTDEASVRRLLLAMNRFGFLRSNNDYANFKFLPPIYRLLQAAEVVARVSDVETGNEDSGKDSRNE